MELSFIVVGLNVVKQNYRISKRRDDMVTKLIHHQIVTYGIGFSDVSKFLEFFNFLSGEFDLLYHGQIKVGEAIIDTRKGYSHDFLESHLPKIEKQIQKKTRP